MGIGTQPDVDRDAINQDMRDLGDLTHQRYDDAGEDPNHQGERDQIELVATQQHPHARNGAVRTASINDVFDPLQHRQLGSMIKAWRLRPRMLSTRA